MNPKKINDEGYVSVSDDELTQRQKLLNSVQYYAKLGWKLIPCHGVVNDKCTCGKTHTDPKERGKHPQIDNWNSLASDNVSQVIEWWEKQPDGNVAVFAKPSGFFVIDIDPRSGGLESWEKFKDELDFTIPDTNVSRTGSYMHNGKSVRGLHIFLKCDQDEKLVGNLQKLDLKGIDIKHNGYLIIAPSMHFSGVTYDWVEGYAPWDMPMAEAPVELMKLLRQKGFKSRSRGKLDQTDWDELVWGSNDSSYEKFDLDAAFAEDVEEGSRNNSIYRMTCAIANRQDMTSMLGRQAVETIMIRFNAEKIKPPMGLEELLSSVHRAMDFVSNNPKIGYINPEAAEWQKNQANRLDAASKNAAKTSSKQPLVGVVHPPQRFSPISFDDDSSSLVGTLGGDIAQSIGVGHSIISASGGGNINIPKDPDALREEDGGIIGGRSLSDTGNGRRIVDTYGSGIRYTSGLGWFTWDGDYWRPDPEDLQMMELGKRLAPLIASEVSNYPDNTDKQNDVVKWASQAKSNGRIKSAIESANSDERVSIGVDEWDKHEHMLGCMNGVIDLRTGELLKGRPDLLITRRTPVSYSKGVINQKWESFLDFITGGDQEFHDWLQRAAGYTITGMRKYDVLFLVYGPGGSGKNTFVESIVKCLGTKQYAWPMDSTILSANDGQGSSQDLYHWAEIRGKRMVWLDELPESGYLKENSIKKLTGSSEISARSPGERPFTFNSQAKLWISTNHRPIITDDAMWRRIRPIPLTKIPSDPDPNLKEYLFDPEGGLPAVLSWAVEGAVKMLNSTERDALGWCKVVSDAAEIYKQNEDRIGLFLSEETKTDEGMSLSVKHLYNVYRTWTEDRGERPMTQIAFQKKLLERNLDIEGVGSKAIILGRSLLPREVPHSDGFIEWGGLTRFAR